MDLEEDGLSSPLQLSTGEYRIIFTPERGYLPACFDITTAPHSEPGSPQAWLDDLDGHCQAYGKKRRDTGICGCCGGPRSAHVSGVGIKSWIRGYRANHIQGGFLHKKDGLNHEIAPFNRLMGDPQNSPYMVESRRIEVEYRARTYDPIEERKKKARNEWQEIPGLVPGDTYLMYLTR